MRRVALLIALSLLFAPANATAQTRAGVVNVGDAQLNYEITGQGKTVVFIHGWTNTLAIWDSQVPAFSQHYRVLRYDRRGWGKSTGFADISADPDDLRILLDSLGIRSVYLVGLSGGSEVATRFAFAFPNRTEALVRVSGGPPEGFPIPRPRARENFAEIARKHGMDSLGKLVYSRLVWHPPDRTEAEKQRRFEAFQQRWSKYSGRDLLDPRPESGRVPAAQWDRVHLMTIPTLLVNGDHDLSYQMMVADSLAARLPNARKVVIPSAGHAPNTARPEPFNKAVADFFESVDRAPRQR